MAEPRDESHTIRIDDLEITPGEGLVRAGDVVLTLSVREFQLLVAMVEHAGGIVGRDELCRAVWGRELRSGDRSVDVYVSKLRAKLEHAVPGPALHPHPSRASATASSRSRSRRPARTAALRRAPSRAFPARTRRPPASTVL